MKNKRKRFTAGEKVKLLRLHLLEKQPISDICDQHGLNPNVFYRWQNSFLKTAPPPSTKRATDVKTVNPRS